MTNSRQKGKAGEREAVRLLRDITGLDVRRKVRQHEGDSDVEGIPGWSIEVKRDNGLSVDAMWDQAVTQAGDFLEPLLLYRRDRQPWRARWALIDINGWAEASPETWWLWVQSRWLWTQSRVVLRADGEVLSDEVEE